MHHIPHRAVERHQQGQSRTIADTFGHGVALSENGGGFFVAGAHAPTKRKKLLAGLQRQFQALVHILDASGKLRAPIGPHA